MSADIVLLARAADYAARQHIAQRRKGERAEPYINHLTEVAALLAEATDGADVVLLAGGLLHDTLEDTDATYEDLEQRFGPEVAALVAEVTDDKSLPKEERKRLQIDKTPSKSRRAKLLKIADKTSNLRSMVNSPPKGWTAGAAARLCRVGRAGGALVPRPQRHARCGLRRGPTPTRSGISAEEAGRWHSASWCLAAASPACGARSARPAPSMSWTSAPTGSRSCVIERDGLAFDPRAQLRGRSRRHARGLRQRAGPDRCAPHRRRGHRHRRRAPDRRPTRRAATQEHRLRPAGLCAGQPPRPSADPGARRSCLRCRHLCGGGTAQRAYRGPDEAVAIARPIHRARRRRRA